MVGDESAGGKVLKSSSNSKVFFFFSDHGAPGLVGMPTYPDKLTALDLLNTVKEMKKKNMYKEMVMYIESCESGSMFEKYN